MVMHGIQFTMVVKRGYLDRNGNIVIDSKNDAVWPMTEHGTLVKNEGKLGL